MAVRCPKCKFDSADDAAWCDFCKEPFRKPKTPPVSTAPAPAPAFEQDPDALLAGGDGETVPALPSWFRAAAWTFFGLAFTAAMILAGLLLGRKQP